MKRGFPLPSQRENRDRGRLLVAVGEEFFEDDLGVEQVRVKDEHRKVAKSQNGLPNLNATRRDDGDDQVQPNVGEDTPRRRAEENG